MAFNLKDESALAELKQISRITETSMTAELAIAIHERLEKVRAQRQGKIDRIRAISRRAAPKLKLPAGDPADFLYDNLTGLPRQ